MEKHLKPTCMNIAHENWGQPMNLQRGHGHQSLSRKKICNLRILNQPLDNKVYFAGEINDFLPPNG